MSRGIKVLMFVVGWSILFALIRPWALLALILLRRLACVTSPAIRRDRSPLRSRLDASSMVSARSLAFSQIQGVTIHPSNHGVHQYVSPALKESRIVCRLPKTSKPGNQ